MGRNPSGKLHHAVPLAHFTDSRLNCLAATLQEEEGLKEQVDKLVALGPNVVLVERSVARKAQDELLERGISLALNMKRPVLDFIARCTGAEASHLCHTSTACCSLKWSAGGLELRISSYLVMNILELVSLLK